MIGNEEQLDFFELHICVKDYCFARDDRLVGVAILQLKDIVEQVKLLFSKNGIVRYTFPSNILWKIPVVRDLQRSLYFYRDLYIFFVQYYTGI